MAANTVAEINRASVEKILDQACESLTFLLGHDVVQGDIGIEAASTRPAGEGSIHISFKLSFRKGDLARFGFLIVPLRDAITFASNLMELPGAVIESKRQERTLDDGQKDALLEIGNMIGGAADGALRELELKVKARSEGCQGVRKGVRPAMPYREGDPLIVARVQLTVDPFPSFEAILALPDLTQFA